LHFDKPNFGGSNSGATKAFSPASKEVSSATNGSSDPPEQGSCEIPATPNTFLPKSLPNKKGKM
jgi:hypothetical protein